MDVLLHRLVNLCIRQNVITAEDADTYLYGFDLLISSFIHIAVLLLLGAAAGRTGTVAFILMCYIPLQSFGGGYHANTHWACALLMITEMSCALFVIEIATAMLLAIGAFVSVIINFVLAPVQHPNAPFSSVFAERMKRFTRICSTTFFVLAILLCPVSEHLFSCLAMGLILSGFSILSAYVQSERRRYNGL